MACTPAEILIQIVDVDVNANDFADDQDVCSRRYNDGRGKTLLSTVYSGKPLQITQVTPVPNKLIIMPNDANDKTTTASKCRCWWARAAPPKFRKLQLSKWGKGFTEDVFECRRSTTRFVCVENVLLSIRMEDVRFHVESGGVGCVQKKEDENERSLWKSCLIAIF